jgi:hypothetical protein
MICAQARERLALYAGGDLEANDARGVDDHLQQCAGCRQFYQGLESNQTLLRAFRRESANPASLSQMRAGLFSRLQNPTAVLGWRLRLERFLLTGFRKPRYAVTAMALAALVSVIFLPQMRQVAGGSVAMARPDFRNWQTVDATTHDEHHDFGKAYISPPAYKEFAQTGSFPEGTVMILESRNPSGSVLASVKDSSRFEEGWGYFEFRDVSALPSTAGCAGCHREKAARDQVFTQFYPVLRAAAGVL